MPARAEASAGQQGDGAEVREHGRDLEQAGRERQDDQRTGRRGGFVDTFRPLLAQLVGSPRAALGVEAETEREQRRRRRRARASNPQCRATDPRRASSGPTPSAMATPSAR